MFSASHHQTPLDSSLRNSNFLIPLCHQSVWSSQSTYLSRGKLKEPNSMCWLDLLVHVSLCFPNYRCWCEEIEVRPLNWIVFTFGTKRRKRVKVSDLRKWHRLIFDCYTTVTCVWTPFHTSYTREVRGECQVRGRSQKITGLSWPLVSVLSSTT